MSNQPVLLLLGAAVVCASALPAQGQPPAAKEQEVRLDRHGDPLPQGARARLGTTRFRLSSEGDFLLSPDGKWIALCEARSVRVCALPSGKEQARFTAADEDLEGPRIYFSPDGSTIALCASGKLTLRRLDNLAILWESKGEPDRRSEGTFSPDGKCFVSWGTDHRAYVWETGTGKLLHKQSARWLGDRYSVTPSPDGKVVAADALWEASTGKPLRPRLPGGWDSLVLSPGGRLLACCFENGKRVHLWRADSPRPVPLALGESLRVWGLQFAPDGKTLVGFDLKKEERSVLSFWDPATGKQVRVVEVESGPRAFALSPDGQRLALAEERSIRLFALATGKPLHTLRGGVTYDKRLTFSQDGKTLYAHDGQAVRFWDVGTGAEFPESRGHSDEVSVMAQGLQGGG
jgi:WD40 repeat protein